MQTAVLTRPLDPPQAWIAPHDQPKRETLLRPFHMASTAQVEAPWQFDAWRALCGSFVEFLPPPSQGRGFDASCQAWKLGPFALCSLRADAACYRRDRAQLRRDALDHWVIRLAHHGSFGMRTAHGFTMVPAGNPVVISLANAFEAERSAGAWISLVVPRDSLPAIGPVIDRRLHAPLDGSLGMLLGRYLGALEQQLGSMTEAELPRLAAATRAMIAACIVPTPDHLEAAAPVLEHTRLERARQAIRQHLRSPTLTPKRLCRQVGMSRSQLYRLFEPLGGVARYIQAERLREAYRALADPDNQRDIHEVAEDLGFFDASVFSRTFRREYGCRPSDVRAAALTGSGEVALRRLPVQRQARTITDMLRMLQ